MEDRDVEGGGGWEAVMEKEEVWSVFGGKNVRITQYLGQTGGIERKIYGQGVGMESMVERSGGKTSTEPPDFFNL